MIRYSESSQLRRKPTEEQLAKAAYSNEVNINDEGKFDKPAVTSEMTGQESSDELKATDEGLKSGEEKKSEFVTVDLVDKSNSKVLHQTNNNPDKCNKRVFANVGEHETDWKVRLKDLVRPEMLRPLGLVIGFFFFLNASGIAAMRPYFIRVFEKLNFPITPLHSTVSRNT